MWMPRYEYNSIVPLSKEYNCKTKNIVYLVQCLKCQDQYIGETKHTLEHRFNQHIGYVNINVQRQATGKHFNSDVHLKVQRNEQEEIMLIAINSFFYLLFLLLLTHNL